MANLYENKGGRNLYANPQETNEPPETMGWKGVGKDIWSAAKAAPGAIVNDLPAGIANAGHQVFANPERAEKNILAGGLNWLALPFTIPGHIQEYLSRKGINLPQDTNVGFEGLLGKNFHKTYPEKVKKLLELEGHERGDEALRMAPEFLAFGGAPLVKGAAKLAAKGVDVTTKPLRNYISESITTTPYRQRLASSKAAHEAQMGKRQETQSQFAEEIGLKKPEAIQHKINQLTGEIDELSPTANSPYQQTENLLESPSELTSDIEKIIPNALKATKHQNKEISYTLGEGRDLDVELAPKIQEGISRIKKRIQKEYYTPAMEWAEKNYAEIPSTPEMKTLDANLEAIKENTMVAIDSDFNKFKDTMMKKTTRSNYVKVADLIKEWQETGQAARIAAEKGFKERGENKLEWQRAAHDLEMVHEKQLSFLNGAVPEDLMKGLLKGGKAWGQEVGPFYGHKLYESTKKTRGKPGRVNAKNILEELRGEGEGNVAMRKLLLSDPEMTRMAIGHTYAKNPEGLLDLMPHELEFVNKLPRLPEMIANLKKRKFDETVARAQHEIAQEKSKIRSSEHKELIKSQTERQKAISKIKSNEAEIADLTSKRAKLKSDLKKEKITEKEWKLKDDELKKQIEKINFIKTILGVSAATSGVGFAVYGLSKIPSAISNALSTNQ